MGESLAACKYAVSASRRKALKPFNAATPIAARAAATLAGVDLVRHAITPASAAHGREQAPGARERSTDASVYEVRLHADADGRVSQSGQ